MRGRSKDVFVFRFEVKKYPDISRFIFRMIRNFQFDCIHEASLIPSASWPISQYPILSRATNAGSSLLPLQHPQTETAFPLSPKRPSSKLQPHQNLTVSHTRNALPQELVLAHILSTHLASETRAFTPALLHMLAYRNHCPRKEKKMCRPHKKKQFTQRSRTAECPKRQPSTPKRQVPKHCP